ncbi:MAG TPA: hypothetical protein VGE83_04560 [Terracidiphilus sp.]
MGRTVLAVIGLLAALTAGAQYPGQVTKSAKDSPELRSIAVLEWTGEEGNPKASRLVPVAVLDGGQLQDGGIYLARPEPMALTPEVEYELEQNGKPVGLFDIKNAGQEQGSWVGYGAWKPMPAARPRPSARDLARNRIDDDVQSDEPVLHRKHHADDAPAAGTGNGGGSGSGSGTGADSGGQAQTSDPDRPTLHKKSSGDSTSGTSASKDTSNPSSSPGTDSRSSNPSTGSPASTSTSSSSTPGPDRPTLHKKDSSSDSAGSGSGTSGASTDDSDRPVLKKSKKNQPADIGHAEAVPDATDPDRPRLKRGKSSGNDIDVAPSLMGFPPDLQQAVAVSDAKTHPEHPWSYSWSNPDDEAKMKSSLEDMARDALGLNPPPAKATPAPKRATTTKKSAKPAPTPRPPAPLVGEQFRVFELAYGSGATLVLTAHTDGPAAQQKFVTLVAQPDLYGNVLVLLKNVTDGAHLDQTPRMRLVDAVDALADNRGELLFELRGATLRQFALYRVLRGQAEKLFVSGGGEFGAEKRE